jgi:hypothetical protein
VIRLAILVRFLYAALLLGLLSDPAGARILSYSPLTDRPALPAVQFRAAPHLALIESEATSSPNSLRRDRLIVYDPSGDSGPRALFPTDGSPTRIFLAAVFEESDGVQRVLVLTAVSQRRGPPQRMRPTQAPNRATRPTWLCSFIPLQIFTAWTPEIGSSTALSSRTDLPSWHVECASFSHCPPYTAKRAGQAVESACEVR